MKKLLSLIFTLSLVFSVVGVAFAKTTTTTTTETITTCTGCSQDAFNQLMKPKAPTYPPIVNTSY